MPRIVMTRTGQRFAALGLAVAVGFTLAACSSNSSNPINTPKSAGSVVVGSANFPEDEVLAEIYSLALQHIGVKVTDKFNIGARALYYPEVVKGAVTILPEYNGALLTTSVDTSSTAASTEQIDAALAAKLPSSVEVLNPSAAQDKDSVTVTQAFAAMHHLTSIADLKPVAKTMVFGGPPEFKTRVEGLVGLKQRYGLNFKGFLVTDLSGPISLADLKSGKIQASDIFTTTPQILADKLVSLADPQNLFAAQNVLPLVYKKGVNAKIIAELNAISAKLTTAALIQMNQQLSTGQSYATVATNWLKSVGLM
jgi:osmoprotectant transport system substrate-binding protein